MCIVVWYKLGQEFALCRVLEETQVFGPDVLRDAEEQVRMIRDNLRVAQSRQRVMLTLREEN